MPFFPDIFIVPRLFVVLLATVRLSPLMLAVPVFAPAQLPTSMRVVLALMLAAALSTSLQWGQGDALGALPDLARILEAVLSELALGLLLSLGVLIAFAAISVAGRIVDVQIGFGLAQVFDPVSNKQQPIITAVLSQATLVLFLLTDAHHALLRGLALSFQYFPLGQAWSLAAGHTALVALVGAVFSLGFALVAPVVLCLLLVEAALGVVARSLPQMNMIVIGTPVKIVLGLGFLALWSGGMGRVMMHTYNAIYLGWERLFALQAGGA